MLFSSSIFLFIFLPFFLLVYYVLPRTWHNTFLFAASLVFYAWGEGPVVLVLLVSALINYTAGWLIERGQRSVGLWVSVGGSLALLGYYKYAAFLVDSLRWLVGTLHLPVAEPAHVSYIALPIGISFYTFQGISYVLDIYRGHIRANRSFLDYGTYVAMFPHQIAGPIVRYADIAPELSERFVSVEKFAIGCERFIIGLAKKVLLANTFAWIADDIFTAPNDTYATATAWLAIVSYSLQIYFDFSGYSDMAIGLGKMVGFDFKENFNYPYSARSIQDFWRRWHISLSSWFRDYLYVPLGGNRGSKLQTYRNLLIVFFLTGLWHGASWNFIVWGMYHGLFLIIERAGLGKHLARSESLLTHAYTMIVVLIGWVFFRIEKLPDALVFIQKMAGLRPDATSPVIYPVAHFLSAEVGILLVLSLVLITPVYPFFQRYLTKMVTQYGSIRFLLNSTYVIGLFGLFILAITYLAAGTYNPFIYFRF